MSGVLFEDDIFVAYHTFWIREEDDDRAGEGVGGQRNGLCGAAEPEMLVFYAGTHSGTVPLCVELLDGPPGDPDAAWAEVVEVSWATPAEGPACLAFWEDSDATELGLPAGTYRVRYCCRDLDDQAAERYLVQFWPAPAAPDAVLRETGPAARYRHEYARRTP